MVNDGKYAERHPQQERVRELFAGVADHYAQSAYLAQVMAKSLCQRLQLMTLQPSCVVDLGCGSGFCLQQLKKYYPQTLLLGIDLIREMLPKQDGAAWVVADMQQLPLATACVDVVVANLSLLWSDLQLSLEQIVRVLKPNGLLLFSSLGPDSLQSLRQDYDRQRLMDMHHIGDLLLQLGFRDPVMEMEYIDFNYQDEQVFLKEYHSLGLSSLLPLRDSITAPLQANFEVIYAHAWRSLANKKVADNGEVTIPLTHIRRRGQRP